MKEKCTYLNNLKQHSGAPYVNPNKNKDNPLQNMMLKTEPNSTTAANKEPIADNTVLNNTICSNVSKRFQKYKKRRKQKEIEYKKKLASIYNNDIKIISKPSLVKSKQNSNKVIAIKPIIKFEYDKIFENMEEKIFNNEQMSIDQSWIHKDQNEMAQEVDRYVYADLNKSNTISEITIRRKKRIISTTRNQNHDYNQFKQNFGINSSKQKEKIEHINKCNYIRTNYPNLLQNESTKNITKSKVKSTKGRISSNKIFGGGFRPKSAKLFAHNSATKTLKIK